MSDRSSLEVDNLFSFKRYFINNLDSYHGEFLRVEIAKVLENFEKIAQASTRNTSQTVMGEDAEPLPPPPPELPYELIGKYTSI